MASELVVPLHRLAVDESITYHFAKLRHNTSEKVFAEIAGAFAAEPHLLPVSAAELEQSFETGHAIVALADLGKRAVGFTRILPITGDEGEKWYELGSTWVAKEYRHRGINRAMYEILLARHHDKNILATTTNSHSLALGESIGLVLRKRRELPEHAWKASCVCGAGKMGALCADKCERAFGESQQQGVRCYFRVTAETAKRLGW